MIPIKELKELDKKEKLIKMRELISDELTKKAYLNLNKEIKL